MAAAGRARRVPRHPRHQAARLVSKGGAGMHEVTRATTASRLALVGAIAIVVALAAAPYWGSTASMRLLGEIMVYLALANLWNLLAGFTGLVSVGQQAY